jgi:hypothetical protein
MGLSLKEKDMLLKSTQLRGYLARLRPLESPTFSEVTALQSLFAGEGAGLA